MPVEVREFGRQNTMNKSGGTVRAHTRRTSDEIPIAERLDLFINYSVVPTMYEAGTSGAIVVNFETPDTNGSGQLDVLVNTNP